MSANDVELIEVAPGRYRVKRTPTNFARSDLSLPYVISDAMPPTEQVDGQFYTSKRAFRAVGKSLGLIEIGTEKFREKPRSTDLKSVKDQRQQALRKAMERVRAG